MQQGLLALLLPVLDSSWGLKQLCLLGYFSLTPSPPVSPCDLSSLAVSRKWIFYVQFHSSQSTHFLKESGENHAVLLNLASEHTSVTPTTFYWSQIFLGSRGGNMDTRLSVECHCHNVKRTCVMGCVMVQLPLENTIYPSIYVSSSWHRVSAQ